MKQPLNLSDLRLLFSVPVLVAALGYFVDIYDLLLFGIVRIPSLQAMGLSGEALSTTGISVLNWQMSGLLLGGILWGVLGDRNGRLTVLFGSILTYSIANIACGFASDPSVYKWLRFIAGIGLAGELGAGITLVAEILPARLRALGTSLVAGIGLLGAVAAYFTVEYLNWRAAYFVGGGMGVVLLLLRLGVFESGMFLKPDESNAIKRGNFFALFSNRDRLSRYLKCIGMGLPTWFVIGILATFSNEFGEALRLPEPVSPGLSIMWCYIGLSVGDLASGFISQALQSRKKAVLYMMLFTLLFTVIYLFAGLRSATALYVTSLLLGTGIGYWAMFVTIGAEQFGTNLRATAATTIPNMVRGTVVLMTTSYSFLKAGLPAPHAAALVGLACFIIGLLSILTIPETHNRDMDFVEME